MSKGLFKLGLEYGRCGSIEGLFIADFDELRKAMGKLVYLGEVLGKHSEVYFNLSDCMLELISEDETIINLVKDNNLESGFNPLEYIDEDEDE